ncbi:MAG: hypothetical protein NVS3B3_11330 [Aquirhabdus sp.]
MPLLIHHIDEIAREKKCDVLFVIFHEKFDIDTEWEALPIRQQLLQWLDAHDIPWQKCAHFADPNLMLSYLGQIYIDVPYDESNSKYQELRDYLEFPDGSIRNPGMQFCYLPLAMAMKNAHHDEPGFWEKWAEDF